MTQFRILIPSVAAVRNFVNAATLCPVDIDVTSGRYTVDAKSIMGLFSLDLERPINVTVYGTAEDGAIFKESISELILTEDD